MKGLLFLATLACSNSLVIDKKPLIHPVADFYNGMLDFKVENQDNERKLREWTANNPQAVHVVEEHNQAMRWWVRSLHGSFEKKMSEDADFSTRRLLVHIDSHADFGVGTWDLEASIPRDRKKLANFMAQNVDIGSFVSASVAGGIVSDVVWVRSNFENSTYNGPEPGLYRVGLFRQKEGKEVCQKIISRKKDWQTEGAELEKARGITVDGFSTCSDKQLEDSFATFNMMVTSLPFMARDMLAMKKATDLNGAKQHHEWLLDIDQDFFASYAPGFHYLEHYLNGLPKNKIQNIRHALSMVKDSCDTGRDEIYQLMETLPQQEDADFDWEIWSKKADCKFTKEKRQQLHVLTKGFSSEQNKRWKMGWRVLRKGMWVSDPDAVFDVEDTDDHMPEHVPEEQELSKVMDKFGHQVQKLGKMFGKPKVITLCRSLLNGYLPKTKWHAIESGVERELKNALGAKVELIADAQNPKEELYDYLV